MKELNELLEMYSMVSSMTEETACEYMNADSKSDALEVIQDEIDFYRSKVEEAETEESDWCTAGLDTAFASWEQVNSMFV